MGIEEVSVPGTELVDLSDESLGRLTVRVPMSWTVTAPAGRSRVVFVDVDDHVGDGFLPNVALRIDAAGVDDGVPSGNLVLSDRVVIGESGERRIRTLLSEVADDLLVQQVTTLDVDGVAAAVVASATQSQWKDVADEFDAVASSASIDEATR